MKEVQVGQVAKGQIVEFRFDQRPEDMIQAIVVKQVDPTPVVETQPEPEIKVIMSGEPSLDAMVQETKPKSKKSK